MTEDSDSPIVVTRTAKALTLSKISQLWTVHSEIYIQYVDSYPFNCSKNNVTRLKETIYTYSVIFTNIL
jgi:hypothetical protein